MGVLQKNISTINCAPKLKRLGIPYVSAHVKSLEVFRHYRKVQYVTAFSNEHCIYTVKYLTWKYRSIPTARTTPMDNPRQNTQNTRAYTDSTTTGSVPFP
jgi:hypothetical protein